MEHVTSRDLSILDGIYSLFDELCAPSGNAKVETVGKRTWRVLAYKKAASNNFYADLAIQMGLDMLYIIKDSNCVTISTTHDSGIGCRQEAHCLVSRRHGKKHGSPSSGHCEHGQSVR
jgi:hypothetical protein